MERAGKDISWIIGSRKEHAFFGKGYCEKCTGKEQYRERKAKKG
jgi:hypothetical protein